MRISFFLGIKNLFSHKKLVILLVCIIGLSFVNLSFFNSLNNGIRDVTNEKLKAYAFADLRVLPHEDESYILDTSLILKKLRKLNEIESVTSRLVTQEVLTDGVNVFPITLLGVNLEDEIIVADYEKVVEIGNFISRNNGGIVLGDEIVGNLDGSKGNTDFKPLDLEVGENALINFNNGERKEFKVQGIFDTLFWVTDFNVIIDYKELASIYNLSQDYSSEILIVLKEGVDKEVVKNKIFNLGIDCRVVDSIVEMGVADSILEGQEVTTYLANIIGIFSTFITVFIIIFINVSNNKKQLGILKAVGISEKRIINSYIIQGFFYAIMGIIVGYGMLNLVILYLKSNPIKLPMGFFYPIVNFKEILISSLIVTLSSIIASYLASFKIVKQNIVSVLRGG